MWTRPTGAPRLPAEDARPDRCRTQQPFSQPIGARKVRGGVAPRKERRVGCEGPGAVGGRKRGLAAPQGSDDAAPSSGSPIAPGRQTADGGGRLKGLEKKPRVTRPVLALDAPWRRRDDADAAAASTSSTQQSLRGPPYFVLHLHPHLIHEFGHFASSRSSGEGPDALPSASSGPKVIKVRGRRPNTASACRRSAGS